MRYQTISEIYDVNGRVRAKLTATLEAVNEQQAAAVPDSETWSVAQIAEHLSMVGFGMYRICAKLLAKAEEGGKLSDGSIDISEFAEKAEGISDIKLEAPEIVHPTGTKPIADSIRMLEKTGEAFGKLRPLFEKYDAGEPKFPHPYLGDMTAVEWLAMYGAHEGRHLRQIKNILRRLDESTSPE